jgi:hypothetical protein
VRKEWKRFWRPKEIVSDVSKYVRGVRVSSVVALFLENYKNNDIIDATNTSALNISHIHHLESVQYNIRDFGFSKAAFQMFSSLSSSNIITVGIEIVENLFRHHINHGDNEIRQLQRLDTLLVSFPKLSRLLVLYTYYPHSPGYRADTVHRVFPLCKARGILVVEKLLLRKGMPRGWKLVSTTSNENKPLPFFLKDYTSQVRDTSGSSS